MHLTRHAKNRARLYGLTLTEIESIVSDGAPIGRDRRGNRLILGASRDGRAIEAVIAFDNADVVITLIEREY